MICGLGLIASFVVQMVVAGSLHWWHLVPGCLLVLGGVAEIVPQAQPIVEKGWPLILIALGLVILAGPIINHSPYALDAQVGVKSKHG